MSNIRIACIQQKVWKDKYDNIEQLAEILGSGRTEGADFISLPEMWNCPYVTELYPVHPAESLGRIYYRIVDLSVP